MYAARTTFRASEKFPYSFAARRDEGPTGEAARGVPQGGWNPPCVPPDRGEWGVPQGGWNPPCVPPDRGDGIPPTARQGYRSISSDFVILKKSSSDVIMVMVRMVDSAAAVP